jgi:uncharacterized protein (UPF0548 family)
MTTTTAPLSTSPSTDSSTGAVTAASRRTTIGWRAGAVALVVGAGLNTAQAALSQVLGERPEEVADQITMANEHTGLVTSMVLVGTLAVPFMAVGFVAAAQELRRRAPRTAYVAATFLLLGMWGFMAMHVAELVQLVAMLEPGGREAALWMDGLESEPLLGILFGFPFMIGCVVGMLTLSIGMLVTGVVARWIPALFLVFILLDFSIGAVGPVDPHWLYFAGALGLTTHIVRNRPSTRAVA